MKKKKEFYPITSVCKEDILAAFRGKKNFEKVKKRLEQINNIEMEKLASKLSDDYCNQLYWDSLRTIFKDRFM